MAYPKHRAMATMAVGQLTTVLVWGLGGGVISLQLNQVGELYVCICADKPRFNSSPFARLNHFHLFAPRAGLLLANVCSSARGGGCSAGPQ